MKVPDLMPEEQAHIDHGGRVFIVEEIPGPLWRVLVVKGDTCRVMLKPDRLDGYSSKEEAELNALAIANLANDRPLVRGSRF